MKKILIYIFAFIFIAQYRVSNAQNLHEAFEVFFERNYALALQKVAADIETSPYAYAIADFIISNGKIPSDSNQRNSGVKGLRMDSSTSSSAAVASASTSLSKEELTTIKQKLNDISEVLEGTSKTHMEILTTIIKDADNYFFVKNSPKKKNLENLYDALNRTLLSSKCVFSFLMIRNFIPGLLSNKEANSWNIIKELPNTGYCASVFAERIWSQPDPDYSTDFVILRVLAYLSESVLLGHTPLFSQKQNIVAFQQGAMALEFRAPTASEFLVFLRNQLKQKGVFEKIDLSNSSFEDFYGNIVEQRKKINAPEAFPSATNIFASNIVDSINEWTRNTFNKQSNPSQQTIDLYRDLNIILLLINPNSKHMALNNLGKICENFDLKINMFREAILNGSGDAYANLYKLVHTSNSTEKKIELLKDLISYTKVVDPSLYLYISDILSTTNRSDNKKEILSYYKKGIDAISAFPSDFPEDMKKQFPLRSILAKFNSFGIYFETDDWKTLINPEIEEFSTEEKIQENYEKIIEDLTEYFMTSLGSDLQLGEKNIKDTFFKYTGLAYRVGGCHLKKDLARAFDISMILVKSKNRQIRAIAQNEIISMQEPPVENIQGLTEEAIAEIAEKNYNLTTPSKKNLKKMNKFLQYYIEHPEEIIAPTLNSWLGSFLIWKSNKDHKMAPGEIKELRSHGVKLLEASLNPSEVFLSLTEINKVYLALKPHSRVMTRVNLIKTYMQLEKFEKAVDAINNLEVEIMGLKESGEYLNEEVEYLFLKTLVSKKTQSPIYLGEELDAICSKIRGMSQEEQKTLRPKSLIKLGVLIAQQKEYDEAKYIFNLISSDQDIKYLYLLMVKKAQNDLDSQEAIDYLDKAKKSPLSQLRFLYALYNISSNTEIIKDLLQNEKETIEKYRHIWKLYVAHDNPFMPQELKEMLYPEECSSSDSSAPLETDSLDDSESNSSVEDLLEERLSDEEDEVDDSDEEQLTEIYDEHAGPSTNSKSLNTQTNKSKNRKGKLKKRDFSKILAQCFEKNLKLRWTKNGVQILSSDGNALTFHKAHGRDRLCSRASHFLKSLIQQEKWEA